MDDGDFVVTRLLSEALNKLRANDITGASFAASRAKELSPNFFETDRVMAQIYAETGSLMKAEGRYESAISLNPEHAPLRLWYGDFLLKKMDDIDLSKAQYKKALELSPDSIETLTAYGLALVINGEFEEAEKLTLKAVQENIGNLRLKRRALDIRLKFYTRKLEHQVSSGTFDDALKTLESLQLFADGSEHHLIDRKMLVQGEKIHGSVLNISEFYLETAEAEKCSSLVRWFNDFFVVGQRELTTKNSEIQLPKPTGEQTGKIATLHKSFGFISYQQTTIFFPFSEWLEDISPSDKDCNSSVSFIFGSNEKGPCANEVQFSSSKKQRK
jgi:tetratricopeptide (TPR) repeat protein